MIQIEKDRIRKTIPKVLDALKKKNFDPYFFETADKARNFIIERIEPQETVGIGGSVTFREELGIVESLRKRGNYVCDHYDAYEDPARRLELKRKQRGMDVFLSSVNALTSEGILVNLDGGGNRVAGTCSGPKKVIIAAGTNKIVDSLELAIHRTRHQAAVINAMRLKRKTPCTETGVCIDCDSPERICAALLILLKKPNDIDLFTVVLINEEMGY
ncbi:MAG: lactate utilization protein [Pseudomonadota bacterium]